MKKINNYLTWTYHIILGNIILRFEYYFYILYKNLFKPSYKKRLFISSGNISLLNILTIIKQLNEKNTEDYLIIDTVQGTQEFFNLNKNIAQMHNFKKILVCKNNFALFELIKHNIFQIDEIYSHTNRWYIKFIQPIFHKSNYYIHDEGMGSLFLQPCKNNKHIKKLYFQKYLDKIDYIGWDNYDIINLDKKIFKKIAYEVAQNYPFDIKIEENSKTVIFCGAYWRQFKLSKIDYYNLEKNIIEKLINRGYSVIYKKHPREIENIDLPVEVKQTKCLVPLDVYNLNILGVVSICSTASIHSYTHWNIPGFYAIDEQLTAQYQYDKLGDVIQSAIMEYSLNINTLLEISPNSYSSNEILKYLQDKLQNKLKSKEQLSKNKKINEYYRKYIEYTNN